MKGVVRVRQTLHVCGGGLGPGGGLGLLGSGPHQLLFYL